MHFTVNSFNRELSRMFDSHFEEEGLATSYIELLLFLYAEKSLSQNQIAERMNLAPSTITRFIRKLEKLNLVEKKKQGRSVEIDLTDNGKKMCPRVQKKYEAAVGELETLLGEKYVTTVEQLLEHGVKQLRNSE